MRSAPVDHVVIMLSTVETLDTVHLRLVSLAIVDGVVVLCEQVIVSVLCEREQIKDVDGMTEKYDFKDARRYLRQSLGHHSRSHRRRRRRHRNHRRTWLVGREGEGRGRVLYREMHRSQSRSLKSQNHTWRFIAQRGVQALIYAFTDTNPHLHSVTWQLAFCGPFRDSISCFCEGDSPMRVDSKRCFCYFDVGRSLSNVWIVWRRSSIEKSSEKMNGS